MTPNPYISIKFQEGIISENGVNGTTMEEVIEVLVTRLKVFQAGKYPCSENDLAIGRLMQAKEVLEMRTTRRNKAGIEGTYQENAIGNPELLKG